MVTRLDTTLLQVFALSQSKGLPSSLLKRRRARLRQAQPERIMVNGGAVLTAVPLLLLAACQQAQAPANHAAAAPAPQKAAPASDVSAAERLVRARIAGGGAARFAGARRSASDGVPIVCGTYEQGGRRQRYVVVNGEEAFVEPQMHAGEMDRAVAEFCGRGTDNRPPPATPAAENRR
jgi:hypothetical protein